jgi:hypothetical protein
MEEIKESMKQRVDRNFSSQEKRREIEIQNSESVL